MVTLKFIKEVFAYTRNYRGRLLKCATVNIIVSLLCITQPVLMLKIFDAGIQDASLSGVVFYTCGFVAIIITSTILEGYASKQSTLLGKEFTLDMRMECIEKIRKTGANFNQKVEGGLLYTLLYSDIEKIPSLLTGNILELVKNFLILAGLGSFLFSLQYQLLLILIFFQILMIVSQRYFFKLIKEANEKMRASIIGLNKRAQEFSLNLNAVTVSGLFGALYSRLLKSEQDNKKSHVKAVMTNTYNYLVINFLNSLMVATILCIGGLMVIKGNITIGALITFNIFSQRFAGPMSFIYRFPASIQEAKLSWSNIKEYIFEASEIPDNGKVTTINSGEIIFKDVSFNYLNRWIIRNMSFKIPDKSTCTIVGHSGAGKSTILKLLFKLWVPQNGKITIGKYNMEDFSLEALRDNIAFVAQEPFFINDSLRANLSLDKQIDDDTLLETINSVGLSEWYSGLREGLDTCLGDNGVIMSGGEKQRLAIARALLKKPLIVLLDEPTSMLDKDTEIKILGLIEKAFSEITTIIVTHKPHFIWFSDQTIFIENGVAHCKKNDKC